MKNVQNSLLAAVCGLVLVFTTAASAQDVKQGVATVVRVKGGASYTLESGPNATWFPLVPGKILQAGATIKTEAGGMVDVVLGKSILMPQAQPTPDRISYAPDSQVRGMVGYKPSAEQNVIRLSGDTTLKIDKLTVSDTGVDTVSDTELDLQKGRIFASVKKLSAASQYFIKIPNGIAGVRGTFFTLDSSGRCAVGKNSVWLSYVLNGQTITVQITAGHQFDPSSGQTGPLPSNLLDVLQQIAVALDTVYLQVISFSYDLTLCHISSTSGHFGGSGETITVVP